MIRHSVDYGFDNIKPFPVDKKELVLNCPVHGEFTKKISLLLRGVGCNICSQINKGKKSQSNTEEFIKKAKKYIKISIIILKLIILNLVKNLQ